MSSPRGNKTVVDNEEVFALLEKGNASLETSLIDAIDCFFDASEKLKCAVELNIENEMLEEQIIELYDQQCRIYGEKARVLFLDSLKNGMATHWTHEERSRLFSKLFNDNQSFPCGDVIYCNHQSTVKNLSLEDRLAALRIEDQYTAGVGSSSNSYDNNNDREARISNELSKLGINLHCKENMLSKDSSGWEDEDEIIAMAQDAAVFDVEVKKGDTILTIDGISINDYASRSNSEHSFESELISDDLSKSEVSEAVNYLIAKTAALVDMENEPSNVDKIYRIDENSIPLSEDELNSSSCHESAKGNRIIQECYRDNETNDDNATEKYLSSAITKSIELLRNVSTVLEQESDPQRAIKLISEIESTLSKASRMV